MAVEVCGSEGGDGEGSGFGPVPAGAFQTLGHELFAGELDHAQADLPAVRFGGGVVPVVGLVADIGVKFFESLARATASRVESLATRPDLCRPSHAVASGRRSPTRLRTPER